MDNNWNYLDWFLSTYCIQYYSKPIIEHSVNDSHYLLLMVKTDEQTMICYIQNQFYGDIYKEIKYFEFLYERYTKQNKKYGRESSSLKIHG